MCYMIEGKGSKTQSNAKKWLYQHTADAEKLLLWLEKIIVDYFVAQVSPERGNTDTQYNA